MTNRNDIISIPDRLADEFNAHDIDKIMAYFSDDCSLEMPRGPEPHLAELIRNRTGSTTN